MSQPPAPRSPELHHAPSMVAQCVSEFLGTFALIFFGVLSIILTAKTPLAEAAPGGLVTVAFAHVMILGVFIASCMYISGAQFNPAVSIALVVAGKQSPGKAGAFIVTQLLAAACAAGMVQLILTPAVANNPALGTNLGATIGSLTKPQTAMALVGLEAILTFTLMFVILGSTVDQRGHKLGGLPIALTVGACIFAAGPLTGASMNPARTFGPAICGSHWDLHWAYWVGPVVGATLAALVYRTFWHSRAGA
jgi:aquaporin TIP